MNIGKQARYVITAGLLLAGCGGKDTASSKPTHPPKERVFTVAGEDVFRRTGPGTNFAPNGFYKPGEHVKVLDRNDPNWVKVENADKTTTWIMYRYLAEYVYGTDKTAPELIILPRHNLGEASSDIIGDDVFPKEDVELRQFSDSSSKVTEKLIAEKRYPVLDFEIHCKLGNTVTRGKQQVNLLAYLGEGYYAYYADGVTRVGDFRTNELQVGQDPDEWVKVKTEKGEGWFSIKENGRKFHLGRSTGIWIPKNYPADLIR